jgi:muconolactone delta-isomerase
MHCQDARLRGEALLLITGIADPVSFSDGPVTQQGVTVKYLVTWRLELTLLSRGMAAAIARVPGYAASLERTGKIVSRYHIVGAHGGVWIMEADSHEELERLLGGSPAYNFSHYDVVPLSDMSE